MNENEPTTRLPDGCIGPIVECFGEPCNMYLIPDGHVSGALTELSRLMQGLLIDGVQSDAEHQRVGASRDRT